MPQQKKKPPRFLKDKKWNDICCQFISSLQAANRSPGTIGKYETALRLFLRYLKDTYGGERTPDMATTGDIEQFICKRTKSKKALSPSTTNNYLAYINAFYRFCEKRKVAFRGKRVPILADSPTEGIQRLKTGIPERDMMDSEVRAFLAAINRSTTIGKRDYALFAALLATGRRRKEITLLRRGDLQQQGEKWMFSFVGKGRVEREHAEMPGRVVDAIAEYHRACGRDFATMDAEVAIFPGLKLKKPMSLNHAGDRFRIYREKAGIPTCVVLHSLRWENAYQRKLKYGGDLERVRKDLGWKSLDQAAHYTRRPRTEVRGDDAAADIADMFIL